MKKIAFCIACGIACLGFGFVLFSGTALKQEQKKLFSQVIDVFTGSETQKKTPGTHQFQGTISIAVGDQNVEIQTFCVDKKGRLLVASGGTQFIYESTSDGGYTLEQVEMPSSIHVFSPDGKEEAVWKIDVTPQALAIGPDNSVYAAGMGKVVHLDESGKVLKTVESPHMAGLPPLPPIPEEEEDNETAEEEAAKKKRIAELEIEIRKVMEKYSKKSQELAQEFAKAKQKKDEDAQINTTAQ